MNPALCLISEEAFNKALATARSCAESALADRPESLAPLLHVHHITIDGQEEMSLCSLLVPFNEHDEKRRVLLDLGRRFYQERNPPPGLQPRDCPDRREVILVFGLSLGGRFRAIVSIPVRRDPENRMVRDGEPIQTMSGEPLILDAFYAGFMSQLPGGSRGGAR